MWNNLIKLISVTNWIQWISISMVLVGGLLQVGKFFIDKQITSLKESLNIEKEERNNNKVDSLEYILNKSSDEIIELKKKTKYVNPYTQPIQTARATVEIRIKTSKKFSGQYIMIYNYLYFGRGSNDLLMFVSDKCYTKSFDKQVVSFRADFNLDATHKNIGKELTFL